jgi:sugar diacid utilization regulator
VRPLASVTAVRREGSVATVTKPVQPERPAARRPLAVVATEFADPRLGVDQCRQLLATRAGQLLVASRVLVIAQDRVQAVAGAWTWDVRGRQAPRPLDLIGELRGGSLLEVPVRDGDTDHGRLHLVRDQGPPWSPTDARRAETLAGFCAAALSRLAGFDELERRRADLRGWNRTHLRLRAALGEEQLTQRVLSILGDLLQCTVEFWSVDTVASPSGAGPELPPEGRYWPVVIGSDTVGFVVAPTDRVLTRWDTGYLRYGARLIALDTMRDRVAQGAAARMRGRLLHQLIGGDPDHDPQLRSTAERLGAALDRDHMVWVVRGRGELDVAALESVQDIVTETTAGRTHGVGLAVETDGRIVAAIPAAAVDGDDVERAIRSRLVRVGAPASIGVSRPQSSIRAAAVEAEKCVAMALQSPWDNVVVRADRLGAMRFLLAVEDLQTAADLACRQLQPLLEHDATNRIHLASTTRAWLEAGGSNQAAATALGLHVSTVKYRLRRAQEILDVSFAEAGARQQIDLALRTLGYLQDCLGITPRVSLGK